MLVSLVIRYCTLCLCELDRLLIYSEASAREIKGRIYCLYLISALPSPLPSVDLGLNQNAMG